MKKTSLSLALFLMSAASLAAESHGAIQEVEYSLQPIDRSKIHPNGDYATSQSISENWSGYAAATDFSGSSADDTVTAVAGSWTVPKLSPVTKNAYCAIWVGIDGYLSDTVEQIGTSHNWVHGKQQNYAWFEMYPNGSYEISGFPLHNGDVITAQVTYTGDNVFALQLINVTQNVSATIPSSYTTSSSALRSSAEWVVEAPYSSGILPLANFKLASFRECSAEINSISGTISNAEWLNTEITMENGNHKVEAQPSSLSDDGAAFNVTWKKL